MTFVSNQKKYHNAIRILKQKGNEFFSSSTAVFGLYNQMF